jgi:hypothetical protein
MMPLEMSCTPLPKKMDTMYEENDDTLLHQKFHYESIFT